MFDAAILEDLAWLGFVPDAGPLRQREEALPYETALHALRAAGLAYACDCTRATFATWAATHASPWRGPGCPGACRGRALSMDDDQLTIRAALGTGSEPWLDRILGARSGGVTITGDQPIRDRQGNWTYGFAVVVDDLRQSISLVVRGEDLVDATSAQIRLGRLLGRTEPPAFAHHPLIRKATGAKLSKADHDTGVRDLRASGDSPETLIGAAAAAIGLLAEPRPVPAAAVGELVAARLA